MLYVENFGVKYIGKEHQQHLMAVLEKHYTISHDWEGKRYLRIELDWDYDRRKVQLSMSCSATPPPRPTASAHHANVRPKGAIH